MYYRRFPFCLLTLIIFFSAGKVYAQSEPPARLFIISPAPGEVIVGTDVKVIVQLPPDIRLADPQSHTVNAEGEGHVHMWLDPVRSRARAFGASPVGTAGAATSNGVDALPAHDNEVSVVLPGINEYTYQNVFSGLHTLHVALFQNDHTPYESRFFAGVEFETGGEEIKPVPSEGGLSQTPSADAGGLFISQGSGNTLFALILIAIFIGLLWYIFGRHNKKA